MVDTKTERNTACRPRRLAQQGSGGCHRSILICWRSEIAMQWSRSCTTVHYSTWTTWRRRRRRWWM